MTPAQVALNQRRLSNAYGLSYSWDAGLAEPVHCTFTDTEGGPCLEAAFVGGVDIYNEGKSALIDSDMVKRIESAAYSHLERQAEQINAERRYDVISGTREALGQLSIRRAA